VLLFPLRGIPKDSSGEPLIGSLQQKRRLGRAIEQLVMGWIAFEAKERTKSIGLLSHWRPRSRVPNRLGCLFQKLWRHGGRRRGWQGWLIRSTRSHGVCRSNILLLLERFRFAIMRDVSAWSIESLGGLQMGVPPGGLTGWGSACSGDSESLTYRLSSIGW